MPVVYSCFCRRPSTYTPGATGIAPVYNEIVDNYGRRTLKQTGVHDLNQFVQTSLPSTLVYNILDRFQQGDLSALQKTQGFYADVTAVPKSLFEAHRFLSSLEDRFDHLDKDLRAKYDFDFGKFVRSINDDDLSSLFVHIDDPGAGDLSAGVGDIAQNSVGGDN